VTLRIVFDARSDGPRRSGIGNYAGALLRSMLELDDDVRFLVLTHEEAKPIEHPRVEALPCPGETKSMSTVVRLGRVRNGFSDYDLYHSPAELVPLGIRCPWVVTAHDLMWIEAPRLASAFLPVRLANSLWYRVNFDRAFGGARAVIAISHATADAIGRIYPRHADKTHVIHHGIDLDHFQPSRAPERTALDAHVPPDRPYSLIVGQGSPYKNHARLIRAFVEATSDTPEHMLVLVRRFSRIDFEMQRLLARSEVRDRIITVPHVDDELLLALYRHARMLLFASLYEGFGMPALEAMAMGTPVLASNTPSLVEVTGTAALHAVPDDHADLVAKIRLLEQNEMLRRQLIDAGRRRTRDFTWSKAARMTLDIYRRATASQ
jgi:glycosyltransferase involved in cell wall biosynthesis